MEPYSKWVTGFCGQPPGLDGFHAAGLGRQGLGIPSAGLSALPSLSRRRFGWWCYEGCVMPSPLMDRGGFHGECADGRAEASERDVP